ncbi:MAG: hypothetical protein ACI8Z1_001895, partial [Candidatus Azotimanducaceae bacterium]
SVKKGDRRSRNSTARKLAYFQAFIRDSRVGKWR